MSIQVLSRPLAALLALLALSSCSSEPENAAAPPKVIVGATLIDGSPRPPVPNAVLIVAEGKIVAAGPASALTIPENAARTNATGLYITPGRGGLLLAPGADADLFLLSGNPIESPHLLASPMRTMKAGEWADVPKQ